jgi:hypothetical protein
MDFAVVETWQIPIWESAIDEYSRPPKSVTVFHGRISKVKDGLGRYWRIRNWRLSRCARYSPDANRLSTGPIWVYDEFSFQFCAFLLENFVITKVIILRLEEAGGTWVRLFELSEGVCREWRKDECWTSTRDDLAAAWFCDEPPRRRLTTKIWE